MMGSSQPRRFIVDSLPEFSWLLEQRQTLTCWELATGWHVQVTEVLGGLVSSTSLRVQGPAPEVADGEFVIAPRPDAEGSDPRPVIAGLVAAHPGSRVTMTRRGCMLDGVWWFVDEFQGGHDGLVIASTTDLPGSPGGSGAAAAGPAWVGAEVTGDAGYDEHTLAHIAG